MTIRIGMIGCGVIGQSHLETYKKIPGCEVTALCDIVPERVQDYGERFGVAGRYTSIGEMLKKCDCDAVDVCLHNNMHAPVSIAVMESGRDCYCEKPMSGSYFDSKRMYDRAKELGRKLHIQLAMIYGDEARAAKSLIDGGHLGEIYHMRSYGFRRRGRPFVDGYARKEFVHSEFSAGGALFDMGVYHISQLLWLAGMPDLERVSGNTYAKLPMDEERRAESRYNVEELGCGYAKFKGGLSMDILESWAVYAKPFPGSAIFGSKGGLSLSPLTFHSAVEDIQTDTTFDLGQKSYLDHQVHPEKMLYDNSQAHWIAALSGKCDLLPTADIALLTQLVQEGIYMSQRLGREVAADEIRSLSVSTALEIPNL